MKALILFVSAMAVCGVAEAVAAVDPIGTWKCEYEIGGQKRTAELTITKADPLVGTMSWPDQKDEPLKDVMLKDGTLTFSAVRKFMGRVIPVQYSLTVNGDKLSGQGITESGGTKQQFDIEGKRVK